MRLEIKEPDTKALKDMGASDTFLWGNKFYAIMPDDEYIGDGMCYIYDFLQGDRSMMPIDREVVEVKLELRRV